LILSCLLLLWLLRQVEHLQSQTRNGSGAASRVEEWLEDKVNAAELLCGRLEARAIRSEAELAAAQATIDTHAHFTKSLAQVASLSSLEADAAWLIATARGKEGGWLGEGRGRERG
jgi:hypothetical protein